MGVGIIVGCPSGAISHLSVCTHTTHCPLHPAGFKFERIGPPQPAEMASIAAERVIETLRDVDKGVVPWFRDAAKTWLAEVGNPEEALALALAKITGEGVVDYVCACVGMATPARVHVCWHMWTHIHVCVGIGLVCAKLPGSKSLI